MKHVLWTCSALLVAVLTTQNAFAANIVADSQTLGVNAAANQRIPDSNTFTVTTAGQVQITLRDLGTPTGIATGFSKLKAIVTQGGTKVASLAAAGSVQIAATPGVYKVQVVGAAVAPAGIFDVVVQAAAGGAPLLQFSGGIDAAPVAPDPAQSILSADILIPNAGSYQLTLTDRALPEALSSVDVLLFRQGMLDMTLSGPCTSTCTMSFTVPSASPYSVKVIAKAGDANKAGVYSVVVSGGPIATTVYSTTQAVGLMPAPQELTLNSGTGTLQVNDFTTPVALLNLAALVTQGGNTLASQTGPGTASLSAAAGAASLFVFAKPGIGGAGSYGISVAQAAGVVFRDARPVPEGFDAAANVGGYRHAFNVPSAGAHNVQLRDLAFPTQFQNLRGVLVQNGVVVQTLTRGTPATPTLASGAATVLVFGTPPTPGTNSLYGISVAPSSGNPVLDQAQGVGPLIATRSFDIATGGAYDLAVDDLQFPDPFAELAVAVTEGSALVGQIFGGGKISFNAVAGPHAISLLPRPAVAAEYGSWGFDVSTTPPAPTVTLASNVASVALGTPVTLTWSTTNATNCTASGGWTGTKAASGTETTAALQVNTTYTLTCVGPGGQAIKSVTVAIASAQAGGSGGGGQMDLGLLAMLALLSIFPLRNRPRLRLH